MTQQPDPTPDVPDDGHDTPPQITPGPEPQPGETQDDPGDDWPTDDDTEED